MALRRTPGRAGLELLFRSSSPVASTLCERVGSRSSRMLSASEGEGEGEGSGRRGCGVQVAVEGAARGGGGGVEVEAEVGEEETMAEGAAC